MAFYTSVRYVAMYKLERKENKLTPKGLFVNRVRYLTTA